jgi:hypothetical protein
MNVSVYKKGYYWKLCGLIAAKNKPNSKPISFSPQHCWGLKPDLKKQSQFQYPTDAPAGPVLLL